MEATEGLEKLPLSGSTEITTVIVHYQTPELLGVAVSSFRRFYPETPLLVFDNGSSDEATIELLNKMERQQDTRLRIIRHTENIFHGPAMDALVSREVTTPYVFFLDSDTEILKPGFLEEMKTALEAHSKNYAAGTLVKINKRGFKDEAGFEIPATPYMMLKTDLYSRFKPFVHHGQPTIFHFTDALNQGYRCVHFPVDEYVFHHWRGTASKFGYGLGWKAKWEYLLNKLGL